MKKLSILFLLLAFGLSVSAATYYISSAGSDAANGTSASTPWKTIGKVNAAFSSFKPGDRILFRRGDTFYGTLKITASGVSGNPIVIGAYGSGEKPVITGFTTVSSWTNEGNGIYSKAVSSASKPNFITIDNVWYAMGRYPNNSYLTYESFYTNISITDNQLGSSPDWTGAEAVIRKNDWILDRNLITKHSGTTINYRSSGSSRHGTANNGYFIQNDLRTLDTFGEWYYDGSKLYVYFGAVNPSTKVIKVPTIDNLVYNWRRSFITIENIQFIGAGRSGVFIESYADNNIIQNCDFDFSGEHALNLPVLRNVTADNNTINHSVRVGVFADSSPGAVITNNTILNSNMLPGAGLGNTASNAAIYCVNSDDALIRNNTIDSSGYNGIRFNGNRTKVINNYINNSVLLVNDGGGIYTTNLTHTGRVIEGNIVLNSFGNTSGTTRAASGDGIYLDSGFSGVIDVDVINNTVANNGRYGITLHDAIGNKVFGNVVFNNQAQIKFQNFVNTSKDNSMHQNILIAKSNTQSTLKMGLQFSTTSKVVTSDNNYYARPVSDNTHFQWWVTNSGWANKTLDQWKTQSGQDANSHGSPIAISDVSNIEFYYNAGKTNRIITLSKPMTDVKGTKYASSITLLPYSSAVLLVDPTPLQAVIPEYLSSAIEDGAPGRLEMTYNENLADIVPPASAFRVMVNSVARTVNSVSISGTKVILTLSSPVINGNVVTVAYTVPATNQLQSTLRRWANSSGTQTVSNNISAIAPVPNYVSSAIENSTPAILEMTYDLSLANIIPATSAFTVRVNSVSRTVNSVAISGTKVLLTLSSPVISGNDVTVAYTVPATNQLQSSLRRWAFSSGTQTVSNKTGSIPPVPNYVSSVIANSTPARIEMTYDQSLANIVPTASAFTVRVNSVSRALSSVTISGSKVLLTLGSPAVAGDVVTVAYTIPSTNQLQSALRRWVYSHTAKTVINNISQTTYKSAQTETNEVQTMDPAYPGSVIENFEPDRNEMDSFKNSGSLNNISIYPNPAREFIHVTIMEPSLETQVIRIFDLSGRLWLESPIDPDINNIEIPINFKSGVYIVRVIKGNLTMFTQKLVVIE